MQHAKRDTRWRMRLLAFFASLLGIQFKVDGLPYGATYRPTPSEREQFESNAGPTVGPRLEPAGNREDILRMRDERLQGYERVGGVVPGEGPVEANWVLNGATYAKRLGAWHACIGGYWHQAPQEIARELDKLHNLVEGN